MNRNLMIGLFSFLSFVSSAQVQLQNGAAQASFPIYSYNDAKSGLSTSVSLQYVMGTGLKVNDLATDVGLGWALGAGGFIQRIQNGEPDDQNSTDQFPINTTCTAPSSFHVTKNAYMNGGATAQTQDYINNYFPNGFLYSEFYNYCGSTNLCQDIPPVYSCDVPFELCHSPRFKRYDDKRFKYSRRALADRTQDMFVFNFNGRSGTFFIGKDWSYMVVPDSKVKIQIDVENMTSQNIRTRIKQFIITDEAGMKYKFNALELAEVFKNKTYQTSTTGVTTTTISKGEATGKYTVQKWFLTEVYNPRTNQKINFTYEDDNRDFTLALNVSLTSTIGGNSTNGLSISEQRAHILGKRLKEIVMPDGNKVEFGYNGDTRVDEGAQNKTPLSIIRILNNGLPAKQYNLAYKYFYKKELISLSEGMYKPQAEWRFLRLCLYSLQESGNDGYSKIPPVIFDYYRGAESTDQREIVPPVRTFAQDHWGYYTTAVSEDFNQVIYPDYQKIVYMMLAPNPYRIPTDSYAKLGILKSVTYPHGGTLTFEYEQNRGSSGVQSNGLPNCNPGVRVKRTIVSNQENTAKDIVTEYSYTNTNGVSSGWSFEPLVYSFNRNFKYLKDKDYDFPGEYSGEYSKTVLSWLTYNVFQSTAFKVVMEILSIASMIYSPDPVSAIISTVVRIILLIIEITNYDKDYTSYQYSFYPYSMVNPIPVSYSRVTTKITSNNSLTGSVVHEFTSPSYYGEVIPPLSFPFTNKMRYAPWKFGLLWKKTVLNSSDSKVSEEENIYNNSLMHQVDNNIAYSSQKTEPNFIISSKYLELVECNNNFGQYLSHDCSFPIHGRVELSQTKIRNYNLTGSNYNETVINYTYNPKNYLVKEVTTQTSNGEVRGEKTYYPDDYLVAGVLQTMKTQNMIHIPVCKIIWKKDSQASPTKKIISAAVTEFAQIANGDIKPIKIYSSELSEPTVSPITEDATVENNLLNYPFLKLQSTVTYAGDGNVSSTEGKGATSGSVLYDYTGQLPVAKISNGKISDGIAYTSFEADGNYEAGGVGKWGFGQSMVIDDHTAVTGKKVLDIRFGIWLNTLNTQKKYKLSFWVKGTRPGININYPNGSQVVDNQFQLLKSVNGWDLYIGEIQGAAQVGIWRQGNDYPRIDELRLYPSDARMATITYDPRFGKTSECDANNRILYYEYDTMGRLLYVRDEQRNIIKTYEYNFKN